MIEPGEQTGWALALVARERAHQEELKAQGRFRYTLADDGMNDYERLACIVEELGEVARNCLARNVQGLVTDGDASDEALCKELGQVAALSVAWMERLV